MASSLLQSVVVTVALLSLLCVVGSVQASSSTSRHETNSDAFYLVESIPLGVDFTPNLTIAESWIRLLNGATKEVNIACMYMTLSNKNESIGGGPGQAAFDAIVAAHKRGVRVRIAKSVSSIFGPDDVERLVKMGVAEAVYVNYTHFDSGGILHTKMMVADETALYVGSANMDWRSLTQIKEFGIYFADHPLAASEINKIFGQYWLLGSTNMKPAHWPSNLTTVYNRSHPMEVSMNGTVSDLFFSVAPDPLVPPGWTRDQDAITDAMGAAEEFIHVEVMDYVPAVIYESPSVYWGIIDTAIRAAAYRGVQVQVLIGYWEHSIPVQQVYLQSLNVLDNVTVKYFEVPAFKVNIPYTRVNHAKWMITDKTLFIDTSNWTGDYFTNTAGIGTSTSSPLATSIGRQIFDRDWDSKYTHDIPRPGMAA